MASIGSDPNGYKRILFVAGDGKRKTVRLGKMNQRQAEAFKVKLESLVSANITGSMDDETSRWLAGLDDTLTAKLAAVGLVKARRGATISTLGPFIDSYMLGRTDIKPNTRIGLGQARRRLVEFFGESRTLTSITEGDADECGRWLSVQVASNTARRLCGRAKQFFRFAVRKKLLTANPFADLESNVRSNPERMFFITADMAQRVSDACPDAQWRLLFALSRYGGLRCPSEHLSLKWSDVDWDRGRLRVPSPKTEHIEGKGSRIIPLFDELRAPLMEVFELAEPGVEHVITRYRSANQNLRTRFQKIIRRAGLDPWPKLFHNLRATRQTELAETLPAHVVCAWLGNTEDVAKAHYLQVTDEHFKRALSESGTRAAQIPAQHTSALAGTDRNRVPAETLKPPVLPVGAGECRSVQGESVASIGVEPILLLGNGF